MLVNRAIELIVANTLTPEGGWGIQFPPDAYDGESVDLARAESIWLSGQRNIHGDPFHLYRGWDWLPLGSAGYDALCEELNDLAERDPDDEYGILYRESPNAAVARWLEEVGDPLELAGFVVIGGRLYSAASDQPLMSGREAELEYSSA